MTAPPAVTDQSTPLEVLQAMVWWFAGYAENAAMENVVHQAMRVLEEDGRD